MAMLTTPRLVLRRWQPADRAPFARMNADPAVMEFFPRTLASAESDALIEHMDAQLEEEGFGLWAAETEGQLAGFIGLSRPYFEAHFTPCVEVGWRLARPFWGRGLATEGARAVLQDGFERVGLDEILSWTALLNLPSIRVMEKLGMQRVEEFMHPRVVEGHRLRPHVLYRLARGRNERGSE